MRPSHFATAEGALRFWALLSQQDEALAVHELSLPDELQASHAVRLQRGEQSVVSARAAHEP
jgi:hypothetical protein